MLVEAVFLGDEPEPRAERDGTARGASPAGASSAAFAGRMDKGKAEPPLPAPRDGAVLRKPKKRGVGPAGSGWLAARVPVAAGSAITSGPQSDTPHSRPASRSQSVAASSK